MGTKIPVGLERTWGSTAMKWANLVYMTLSANQQWTTSWHNATEFELCHLPSLNPPKSFISQHRSFYHTPLNCPFFSLKKIMVETREQNKSTHPGQPVVPRAHKSREQAAAERAAKRGRADRFYCWPRISRAAHYG